MAAETRSEYDSAIAASSSHCLSQAAVPTPAHTFAYLSGRAALPPVVVLLVIGLPAAGKTSLIRHLASSPSLTLHHVCVDDIYNQQHQQQQQHQVTSPPTAPAIGFSPVLWHAARDAAYSRTAELLHSLPASAPPQPHSPSVCHVVCVDDVFHLRSMRQSYYRLCRSLQSPFLQLIVNTPLALCIANLAARSAAAAAAGNAGVANAAHDQLTAEYVSALNERFDWPSDTELRYTTAVDRGRGCELDCSFLQYATAPPPAAHPVREPTTAHVQSTVHELDIGLRRAISARMAQWSTPQQQRSQLQDEAVSGREKKAAAVQCVRHTNELRKRMLTDARQRGTAVYELLQAEEEADAITKQSDEQSRVQAAVQQVVAYFGSLVDSTTAPSVVRSQG